MLSVRKFCPPFGASKAPPIARNSAYARKNLLIARSSFSLCFWLERMYYCTSTPRPARTAAALLKDLKLQLVMTFELFAAFPPLRFRVPT